jgi:hypothetical protein
MLELCAAYGRYSYAYVSLLQAIYGQVMLMFISVGSSHIEGGVEYGTCFQALKEKKRKP